MKFQTIRGIEARKEHSTHLRQKARALIELGMTHTAVAHRLGVCSSTISEWCGPADRTRERYDSLAYGGAASRALPAMRVNGNE